MKEALDKFKRDLFSLGADSVSVVRSVGYEWAEFGAIDGDQAIRIDTKVKDDYTIIYKCPKGNFKKHLHRVFESGILTEGLAKCKTYKGVITLEAGSVYTIDPKEAHEFEFLADSNTLILNFGYKDGKEWEAETNAIM